MDNETDEDTGCPPHCCCCNDVCCDCGEKIPQRFIREPPCEGLEC